MTVETLAPVARWSSIVVVWAGALAAVIVIGLFSSTDDVFAWLSLTLGACTFGALIIQLVTRQKNGFVSRLALSVVGVVIVLAVASGVFWLMELFG